MTPINLLTDLQALGCTLRVEADTLHVSPRALLTKELREQIREHKAALLGLLTPQADDGPWGYASEILGENMWLCMTPADVEALRAEGEVGYLPQEIRALQAMKAREPEEFDGKLRMVHEAKKLFETQIEGVEYAKQAA